MTSPGMYAPPSQVRILRRIARVTNAGILQVLLIPSCFALQKRISETHVAACRVEQFSVYYSVYQIVREAHVPIGVEAVVDPDTEPTIKIDFPGGTLADLLNRLVSQDPQYRWSEDNGVIHVLWHGAHLPIAEVVMAYPGAHHKTVEEIWQDLAARPELKAWLDSNHCSRHEIFEEDKFRTRARAVRISIRAGSTTLAELLDRVETKSRENYWSIIQSPPGKPCEVSIFVSGAL